MATIPLEALNRFTDGINAISGRSADELDAMLSAVDWSQDVADVRDAAMEAMQICCGGSTDLAAMLAADFYDYARELELGEALGAVADSRRVPEATDGAVRAFAQDLVDGKPREEFVRRCKERLDYETKRAAAECVYANGSRDPKRPRFARVPTGSETCEFCIMLASRGFVYHTGESAGKDGHYHANCDCRIVPGWDGMDVAGYDPDAYYDMWKHPENHPELREARNARRRELYAERHGKSVGAMRYRERQSSNVILSDEQFGHKAAKHCRDWGLEPSSQEDRKKLLGIIEDIIDDADEVVIGTTWRDQPQPCTFYRKGDDIVIVNADDEYVTIMKGGAGNRRFLRAREEA